MALLHAKTAAGRQEIDDRQLRLPPPLRSMLLMVDGQRDDDELRDLRVSLRAPDDVLERLEAMGLIEVIGGSPAPAPVRRLTAGREQDPALYRCMYEAMSEAVTRHLGLKGYFLQLKVERCRDAVSLEQLCPDLVAAIGKARSPALAERWLREMHERIEQLASLPAEAVPAA